MALYQAAIQLNVSHQFPKAQITGVFRIENIKKSLVTCDMDNWQALS